MKSFQHYLTELTTPMAPAAPAAPQAPAMAPAAPMPTAPAQAAAPPEPPPHPDARTGLQIMNLLGRMKDQKVVSAIRHALASVVPAPNPGGQQGQQGQQPVPR